LGRPKSGALIGFSAAATGNTDLLKTVIRQKESDLTSTTGTNKPNPHVADGKEGFIE
jgi:hypothetical protein